jgi:hypothetical protein
MNRFVSLITGSLDAHRWIIRAAALSALLVSLSASLARADDADSRQSYNISGSGPRVAPLMDLDGSYLIRINAHNRPWNTQRNSCLFTATLNGVEHPLPARYVPWGIAMPIVDIAHYDKQTVVTFAPGHYQFHISPLADCSYSILVLPWDVDRVTGPMTFAAARLFDEAGTQVQELHWDAKYDAAIYVAGGVKGASGDLRVMQNGALLAKIPLERAVAEDGSVYFHAWLITTHARTGKIDPHSGPLTLKFELAKDGEPLTHELNTALAP